MDSSLSRHIYRLRRYKAASLLILLIFAVAVPYAFACGGPGYYDLDSPMDTPDSLLGMITNEESYGEFMPKEQFLFLYPFKLNMPNEIDNLWKMVYTYEKPVFRTPNSEKFKAALKRGELVVAKDEALTIINQILDLPPVIADDYQDELIIALELIEIYPFVEDVKPEMVGKVLMGELHSNETGEIPKALRDLLEVRALKREKAGEFIKSNPDNARMPTLKFVSFRQDFAQKIPDGWVSDIRSKVTPDTWRGLEQSLDEWLVTYPRHPLFDLVRLWKTRIYYFEGNREAAWENLLSVYPIRLQRVLYEMRYLILQGFIPDMSIIEKIDPVLISAVIPMMSYDKEQWSKLWTISEKNLAQPWAVNMQERLLMQIADRNIREFPDKFPKDPLNPTHLWAELRALVLMKAGRWDEAMEQLSILYPDGAQAIMTSMIHINRGETSKAAEVDGLPQSIRHYLIRVILSSDELKTLERSRNHEARDDARIERGVRLTDSGKWNDAAALIKDLDAEHAELWRKAGALSADQSMDGILTWARFLKSNNGKLFYENDTMWYRSLDGRHSRLSWEARNNKKKKNKKSWTAPWTHDFEKEAIMRHLTTTSEMWLALQTYVKWLSSAKRSPQMLKVVKEADKCYNWLINRDPRNSDLWPKFINDHPVVNQLREEGKRARGKI